MRIEVTQPETLVPLRHAILRPELPIADVRYPTDHVATTLHLAAYEGDTLLGGASVHEEPLAGFGGPAYRLRGMAVVAERRNLGVGAALLGALAAAVRARGAALLWCNGRTRAASFYERDGWQKHGPEFDLLGVPHHIFVKPL